MELRIQGSLKNLPDLRQWPLSGQGHKVLLRIRPSRLPFPLSLGARRYLCAVGSPFDDAEPRRARQHSAPLLLSLRQSSHRCSFHVSPLPFPLTTNVASPGFAPWHVSGYRQSGLPRWVCTLLCPLCKWDTRSCLCAWGWFNSQIPMPNWC